MEIIETNLKWTFGEKTIQMQLAETLWLSLSKNIYRFILVMCQVQTAMKKTKWVLKSGWIQDYWFQSNKIENKKVNSRYTVFCRY